MAFDEKKYLDLAGLQSYDAKIKARIDAADTILDNAIKAVEGNLNTEIANRQAGDLAINNTIGTVTAGKTVVDMINDVANTASGDLSNLANRVTTNENAITAINDASTGILAQAKAYTDTEVTDAIADSKITLAESATTTDGYAKTYVFTQGTTEIGKIDLPKELVVTHGQVVVDPVGQPAGTYIELTIANQDNPIYINVKDLVDVYTAAPNAAEVQIAISDTNVVSASLVDASIDRSKINAAFEADIKALEDAIGAGGSVDAQIDAKINALDADVTSAAPAEAGKGIQVQVVEEDGKITNIVVTGNYDNAYDAKGAADAAQSAAQAYTDTLAASLVAISTTEIDALFTTV